MRNEMTQEKTGKNIMKQYDDNENLIMEMHSYGVMDIAISRNYQNGVIVSEAYLVKKKVASRKKYENAIKNYPDMPFPTTSLEYEYDVLSKLVKKQKNTWEQEFDLHKADNESAKQQDEFCINIMKEKNVISLNDTSSFSKILIGEYSAKESQKLLTKLQGLQCQNIFLCDYETDENCLGCNIIVIELPVDGNLRKQVFLYFAELVRDQGYEAEFDDGQKYHFMKF